MKCYLNACWKVFRNELRDAERYGEISFGIEYPPLIIVSTRVKGAAIKIEFQSANCVEGRQRKVPRRLHSVVHIHLSHHLQ